jgi:hypothetical protein
VWSWSPLRRLAPSPSATPRRDFTRIFALALQSASPGVAHASNDVVGVILGDYSHDYPAESLQHLCAADVLDVLPAVSAVLITVVFDSHLMSSHPMSR